MSAGDSGQGSGVVAKERDDWIKGVGKWMGIGREDGRSDGCHGEGVMWWVWLWLWCDVVGVVMV